MLEDFTEDFVEVPLIGARVVETFTDTFETRLCIAWRPPELGAKQRCLPFTLEQADVLRSELERFLTKHGDELERRRSTGP